MEDPMVQQHELRINIALKRNSSGLSGRLFVISKEYEVTITFRGPFRQSQLIVFAGGCTPGSLTRFSFCMLSARMQRFPIENRKIKAP